MHMHYMYYTCTSSYGYVIYTIVVPASVSEVMFVCLLYACSLNESNVFSGNPFGLPPFNLRSKKESAVYLTKHLNQPEQTHQQQKLHAAQQVNW